MPAAAWLFKPAAYFSLGSSFVANAVLMLTICILSGLVAAKTYDLDRRLAIACVLAWAPSTAAIVTGQNSPIGLLLTLLAIYGLTRERTPLTGVAIGLLCYKPTYAIPLLAVLIVFRRWSALAIVCTVAGGWYLLSVNATAGNWTWPLTYVHVVANYVGPDFSGNAAKVISLPGTLLRVGVSAQIAYAAGLAILLGSAMLFARVSLFEAASVSSLIGLAASPHAWEYDAILGLPTIFYNLKHYCKPWQLSLICGAYLISPLWQFSVVLIRFDPIAIPVIGATTIWIVYTTTSFRSRQHFLKTKATHIC